MLLLSPPLPFQSLQQEQQHYKFQEVTWGVIWHSLNLVKVGLGASRKINHKD